MDPGFRTSQPGRETGRGDPNAGGGGGTWGSLHCQVVTWGTHIFAARGGRATWGTHIFAARAGHVTGGGCGAPHAPGTGCWGLARVADGTRGPGPGWQTGSRDLDPSGGRDIGTSYRCTAILQVYRHPAGIHTSHTYTDILQVYRHPTGIQTSYRYTGILQVYRHPTGIQASCRYADILQVYGHPEGLQPSHMQKPFHGGHLHRIPLRIQNRHGHIDNIIYTQETCS